MKSKKQKTAPSRRQNAFTLTALVVIALACGANIFGAFLNQRFIHAPLDVVYYFRFVALLGGGFAAGYLFTPRGAKSRPDRRLFAGVAYALLATALYYCTDIVRSALHLLSSESRAPWGMWLFQGAPLIALAITIITALFAQHRRRQSEVVRGVKVGTACLFSVYFTYMVIVNIYFASYATNMQFWSMIGSYLVMPLFIAVACYLLLGTVKPRTERIFYSTLIALIYATLLMIWPDVRTDASEATTMTVWYVALTASLVATGVLVWEARRIGQPRRQRRAKR